MAIPTLKTSDRIRLVYTGDPAFGSPLSDGDRWEWRPARPEDVERGASVAVIRPLNGPERLACAVEGKGSWAAEVVACAYAGLCVVEGDPRPAREILDAWPDRPRVALGASVVLASGLPVDPFGQRSSG